MTALWNSDEELYQLARRELFTALIGDAMDKLGLTHQFLPPEIKPIRADMVVIGRAMPVLEADVFVGSIQGTANKLSAEPFGLMFHALDDLRPHEVYVCTGASPRYALWGEMMSTRAIKLGAAGAVVNGYIGDVDGVCIIPQAAEKDAFTAALEKARGEKRGKKAIEGGMSTVEAWHTYGIM